MVINRTSKLDELNNLYIGKTYNKMIRPILLSGFLSFKNTGDKGLNFLYIPNILSGRNSKTNAPTINSVVLKGINTVLFSDDSHGAKDINIVRLFFNT